MRELIKIHVHNKYIPQLIKFNGKMGKMGKGWTLLQTSTETLTKDGSGVSPCHQQCDKHSPLEFWMVPTKIHSHLKPKKTTLTHCKLESD